MRTCATSVCPLTFSKGIEGITGEAGAKSLQLALILGHLFAGEVSVCGLEMSVQSNGKKEQSKIQQVKELELCCVCLQGTVIGVSIVLLQPELIYGVPHAV